MVYDKLQKFAEIDPVNFSGVYKTAITPAENQLISKYFNKYFIYLEPFFSRDNGFYTVLEQHNRLVLVMGDSNYSQSDKRISSETIINIIRHKIIQSGTNYKTAVASFYKDLSVLGKHKSLKLQSLVNIGIISLHKLSGFLEFVGSGIEINYYRKNHRKPLFFSHENDPMNEYMLTIERIVTNKGDRFFIKKHLKESTQNEIQYNPGFPKKVKSFLKESVKKITPTRKRITSGTTPISASMMLAFTL